MNAWVDVAKFAPGYLSLAWLASGAVRKAVVRHHRIRIGPVDEVREVLQTVRTAFMDFGAGDGARTGLDLPATRDLSLRMTDLGDRVTDERLRSALQEASVLLIGLTEYRVPISNLAGEPSERETERREREHGQAGHEHDTAFVARTVLSGVSLTSRALHHLNELERRTIGR
ncbi:hypothetical protein E1264_28670 [Actinomadura sp. KC216]|uniref:hypothetical protein n=1 Tax=Actinomadura sp. KC216 TaxID=2530370 RepID=UPI001049CCE4|nr:hypothetical protein [Actinomadura sp. KC216]TDB83371.1 hypothetical protein E1264_28670 [Actinomadura sp. KC216]